MELTLFFIGASTGSFLNLAALRLPKGGSAVCPSSSCPVCRTRLTALDLIPVLSYLFLRARCRHCGAGIPLRYFLYEVFTGAAFIIVYQVFGLFC